MWTTIHQVYLDELERSGGIDSWILDYQTLFQDENRILGVKHKSLPRKQSLKSEADSINSISNSYSIAFVGQRDFLPVSLRVAFGILRHKRRISDKVVLHRVEYVPIVKLVSPKSLIVLVIHTNHRSMLENGSDSKWRFFARVFTFVEFLGLKYSDKVFSYSIVDAKRIRAKAKSFEVLRQSFSGQFFYPNSSIELSNQILWIGRFEITKDPILALRVFKIFRTYHPDYRLVMVGDGSLRANIQDFCNNNDLSDSVTILNSINRGALGDLMRSSKALLHTSRFEGAPRILLEAAACGLPFVTNERADPEQIHLLSSSFYCVKGLEPEEYYKYLEQCILHKIHIAPVMDNLKTDALLIEFNQKISRLGELR